MLRKIVACVLVSFVLVGCTTVSGPIHGPNGDDGYVVRCLSSESCYEKAEEVCGGRYQVQSTAIVADSSRTEILVTCT